MNNTAIAAKSKTRALAHLCVVDRHQARLYASTQDAIVKREHEEY